LEFATMANSNSPFGLLPLAIQNNATPSMALARGLFAANNTQVCARGDGLAQLTDGYLSAITGAVVASQWRGIAWGFEYLSVSQRRRVVTQYWPGGDNSGVIEVLYVPLMGYPPVQIVAQAASTAFSRAMIGGNMEIAYTAPSATLRGGSSLVAITASAATTATLPWRLIDLWSQRAPSGQPGTDDTGQYNWGVFEFNAYQETGLA
jgi:hypothetical protein